MARSNAMKSLPSISPSTASKITWSFPRTIRTLTSNIPMPSIRFSNCPFPIKPNGNICGTIARVCTTLSEIFPTHRFLALYLSLPCTLNDLVHFKDVGSGKDFGAGPVAVGFFELRALRPGLKGGFILPMRQHDVIVALERAQE